MAHYRKRSGRLKGMQLRSAGGPSLHEVAWQQTHGCCWFCGVKLPRQEVTLDHLIPIAQGGIHHLENLVASCHACNIAKGRRTLEEYRQVCGGRPFAGEREG